MSRAELRVDERHALRTDAFAEIVIWRLPKPQPGSGHDCKYRLALIAGGKCVLRYDSERGKGDHRHAGGRERPYPFKSYRTLLADFWNDVDHRSQRHEDR
jgi:hypothetical protein